MSKLILIGMIMWTVGVLMYAYNSPQRFSSYAKGYQVQLIGKQWGV